MKDWTAKNGGAESWGTGRGFLPLHLSHISHLSAEPSPAPAPFFSYARCQDEDSWIKIQPLITSAHADHMGKAGEHLPKATVQSPEATSAPNTAVAAAQCPMPRLAMQSPPHPPTALPPGANIAAPATLRVSQDSTEAEERKVMSMKGQPLGEAVEAGSTADMPSIPSGHSVAGLASDKGTKIGSGPSKWAVVRAAIKDGRVSQLTLRKEYSLVRY
jgi:hypothetical protein